MTMQHRESIRKGFNRLSPFYDSLAFLFFGKSLWRSQAHFIPTLPHVDNILIIGGGTGKILTQLIHHRICDRYYYLDISDEMVKRAGGRVRGAFPESLNDIVFHAGTVHDLPPGMQFDIIITPYVLDMIPAEDLLYDMRKMDSVLKPNGKWLFSDFNYPKEKGVKQILSRVLIRTLYFLFRVFCSVKNKRLPAIDDVFIRLGYKVNKERSFLGGLLASRVYSKV